MYIVNSKLKLKNFKVNLHEIFSTFIKAENSTILL